MQTQRPVQPNRLPPAVYAELESIVGGVHISQDRAIVETYSRFGIDIAGYLKKHARDPSNIPACVVLPGSTSQVQEIVRTANRHSIPFIPMTNGQLGIGNMPTTAAPTICIHLSRMDRIVGLDEDAMTMRIQPYVDYAQVQAEAMKKGLWNGGTPLATSLCKISSQAILAGLWQTSKKYGTIDKNVVSFTMVLPDGDILQTGSPAVAGLDDFWEYAPGPDLFALFRGSAGAAGIITELTIKLHPWPGGAELPEPLAGRPSIPTYSQDRFDSVRPPDNVQLHWVEFPDLDSQIQALREVAQSGIGMGLNATGVYNAYYCSATQDLTVRRVATHFFPAYNLYLISCAQVSSRQLAYEERVLRAIVARHQGTFLSAHHKPEVLAALSPWNVDCIRHVCGYRMSRHFYLDTWFCSGLPDIGRDAQTIWTAAINTIGETYVTDRGGVDTTPFMYAADPCGRNFLTEADVYPNGCDPRALQQAQQLMLFSIGMTMQKKIGPGITGFGASFEPFTTFFPEMGPNIHQLMRLFRKVLDPRSVCSPGRKVFTEDECKRLPPELVAALNHLRLANGLSPMAPSAAPCTPGTDSQQGP